MAKTLPFTFYNCGTSVKDSSKKSHDLPGYVTT